MRYRFAREGAKTIGSQAVFEPEAIKWPEGAVLPVYFENNFSHAGSLLGSATDLRREEDGWLTTEIAWNLKGEEAEPMIDKDLWLTVSVKHVLEQEHRDIAGENWRIIKSCTLMGIFTTARANPWEDSPKQYFCPECANGKKVNCVGQALHPVTDALVPCASTLDFDA